MPKAIERPAVSLSMAGHCRAEIWLAAHGYGREEPQPKVQRKFDLGHLIEMAVFDVTQTPNGSQAQLLPWWPHRIDEVTDYSTGITYNPKEILVDNRQMEVDVDGFKGHLDGVGGPDPYRVMDSKSMPAYSFARNIKDDLLSNVFSREMVIQQNLYIHGLNQSGALSVPVTDWMLVMVNRDDLSVAVRAGKLDMALVKEGRERLSWARSTSEPVPDWEWRKGEDIPLRCAYCDRRGPCAEIRGQGLEMRIEKGARAMQPKWRVA
jgi:hypothetical protein